MKRIKTDQKEDHEFEIEIGQSRRLKTNVAARVARRASKNRSPIGGHHHRGRTTAFVRPNSEWSRRCIVKSRVVKMSAYGKKAARLHIRYIERNGVEKDGEKGLMYGKNVAFQRDHFVRTIDEEPHQFRFIISPEESHTFCLTEFTRTLMKQMESDLNRSLEWGAVNHYNTDNPHTHVVMRGIDAEGEPFRIDREYIKNGMRRRSMDILTQELGLKNEFELDRERALEVTREGYTSLDFTIDKMSHQGVIRVDVFKDKGPQWINEQRALGRLVFLERLGLAERIHSRAFELKAGWTKRLMALSKEQDIHRLMRRTVGDDVSRHRVYKASLESSLEGVVINRGLSDELYDKHYLMIEAMDGCAHYVELGCSPSSNALKVGSIVQLCSDESSGSLGVEASRVRCWVKSTMSLTDQATFRGSVWMDQYLMSELDTLPPLGFSAQVRASLRQRIQFIQSQGIELNDAAKSLARLQRLDVTKTREALHKLPSVPLYPGTQFKGELHGLPPEPNGARFAEIIDYASQRFAIVTWSKSLEALDGRYVSLVMGEHGQRQVKAWDKDLHR